MKQREILAFFDSPLLRDVVKQPAWLTAIKALITKIEKKPDNPNPSTQLVTPLYQSLPPFQKVLVLHSLRKLIMDQFEKKDEVDELEFRCSPIDEISDRHHSPSAQSSSDDPVERLSTITERWVPQIAYYISADARSVEVEVDGVVQALIKPGELRQKNDLFLYDFYEKMKSMLSLPATLDNLFLPSYPCELPFHQLKFRVALPKAAEFVVSARGRNCRFMHMLLRENISMQDSVFDGGLQEFVSVTPVSPQEDLVDRTLLLVFVCILNCRDLKNDGIIGNKVVDCEDVLEYKVYKEKKDGLEVTKPFPKLHVPFTESLLLLRLDMNLLRHIQQKLTQLDWPKLEKFVTSVTYEPKLSQVAKVQSVRDERLNYEDPNPIFDNNHLLSNAQIAVLKNNIAEVQKALAILVQLPECTTYDLLKLFDPVWAEWRDRYIACQQTATNNQFVFFRLDQKKKIEEFARFFTDGLEAKDLVGAVASLPPSPDIDSWRTRSSPLIWSRDLSPVSGGSSTTSVNLVQSSGF